MLSLSFLKRIIAKTELLSSCNSMELKFLLDSIKNLIYLPNDEVIHQGEIGSNMYFINNGSLNVYIRPENFNDDRS